MAADDAYEVRLGESLAVGAAGVLQNDTDESPLTATLVQPPSNGTVALGPDGGFTYTPYTQRPGELVLAERVNLGARVPGVVVNANGTCPACVIDEDPTTEWYPGFGATQPPTMELVFPQDVSVFDVRILPYTDPHQHGRGRCAHDVRRGGHRDLHQRQRRTSGAAARGPADAAGRRQPRAACALRHHRRR